MKKYQMMKSLKVNFLLGKILERLKKLIFEIASARIKEIFELILLKNINLKSFAKDIKTVLLEFNVDDETTHLNDIIKEVVLENTDFDFISSKIFQNTVYLRRLENLSILVGKQRRYQ